MATSAIRPAAIGALGLAAAALGLAAVEPAMPPADAPTAKEAAPADPPPGSFLIVSAQIQDPRFHHAVILILRHSAGGAFGIIVNHPVGRETIASILATAGDTDPSVTGDIDIVSGGPVQPELGFLVHSADYHRAETLAVDGKVAMTGTKDALKDVGHQKGPKKCFFAFGYAGWGAGQLEAEIARRDWFTIPEDADLVFDDDRGKVWDDALARRGRDL